MLLLYNRDIVGISIHSYSTIVLHCSNNGDTWTHTCDVRPRGRELRNNDCHKFYLRDISQLFLFWGKATLHYTLHSARLNLFKAGQKGTKFPRVVKNAYTAGTGHPCEYSIDRLQVLIHFYLRQQVYMLQFSP